jgi:hypothetical protein
MNNVIGKLRLKRVLSVALTVAVLPAGHAQMLTFSKQKSAEHVRCLLEVLRGTTWNNYPGLPSQMVDISEVGAATLNNKGWTDYVYILEDGIDWCGTAGCELIIAEKHQNGTCRLLYEASGDSSFIVGHQRDHGYRRIYTPCEARFDGDQYQQVRDECPNPDVHH